MNFILIAIKRAFADKKNPINKYIAINAFVFIGLVFSAAFYFLGDIPNPFKMWVLQNFALTANWKVFLLRPWTFFTYAFIHEKLFHLIFNMMVFHWFGNLLIEYLGKRRMLFNFWAGIFAGGLLFNFAFDGSQLIGASAGIMALVFACATLLPDYQIVLAIFGPIRLKYLAGIYLFIDLASMLGSNAGGRLAHIAGAAVGFISIKQLQSGNDWSSIIDTIDAFFKGIWNNKSKLKVVHKSQHAAPNTTEINQAAIDAVLDKISKSGYESLTKSEKEILFKASKP